VVAVPADTLEACSGPVSGPGLSFVSQDILGWQSLVSSFVGLSPGSTQSTGMRTTACLLSLAQGCVSFRLPQGLGGPLSEQSPQLCAGTAGTLHLMFLFREDQ
jgi:hypothetical protein